MRLVPVHPLAAPPAFLTADCALSFQILLVCCVFRTKPAQHNSAECSTDVHICCSAVLAPGSIEYCVQSEAA